MTNYLEILRLKSIGCSNRKIASNVKSSHNTVKTVLELAQKIPYEPSVWTQATVGSDYLVSDGRNKYSVPFDLIGEKVQIRLILPVLLAKLLAVSSKCKIYKNARTS